MRRRGDSSEGPRTVHCAAARPRADAALVRQTITVLPASRPLCVCLHCCVKPRGAVCLVWGCVGPVSARDGICVMPCTRRDDRAIFCEGPAPPWWWSGPGVVGGASPSAGARAAAAALLRSAHILRRRISLLWFVRGGGSRGRPRVCRVPRPTRVACAGPVARSCTAGPGCTALCGADSAGGGSSSRPNYTQTMH